MSDTRKNEPVSHSWFRFRLHCLSNENSKKERCLLIVSTKAEHVKMADCGGSCSRKEGERQENSRLWDGMQGNTKINC